MTYLRAPAYAGNRRITSMFGKPSLLLTTAAIILLSACMLPKDADIVGAAVIAELAQTQNARPSDIIVEKVLFESRRQARVNAIYRVPDVRLSHSVTFVCEATRTDDHWKVKCAERPTP
jgi:hypothetical protein